MLLLVPLLTQTTYLCLKSCLVDTLSSLPNSEEVLYLCLKCINCFSRHETFWSVLFPVSWELSSYFSTVFNSVSRQHHEVWASQFPFLHCLRDVIPPSDACLYGHINWSLVQAQQQSSIGLSQPFTPKRGGKARPWDWVPFHSKKRPVPGSLGASLAKRPHLESGNEVIQVARSLLVAVSPLSYQYKEEGGQGGWPLPDVSSSSSSSPSSSAVLRLDCFSNF